MSELNPILILMAALLATAALTAWGLGIFVAVRLARRRRRPAWGWALAALAAGPVLLGAGALARSHRRSAPVWIAAQAAAVAVVVAAVWVGADKVLGVSAALDLAVLLGVTVAALSPLVILAAIGPRPAGDAETPPNTPRIDARNLHKTYRLGRRDLHVLRGVTLSIRRGEFVAILGASGSGKSTLLHLLGLLDAHDSGRLALDGIDSAAMCPPQRDRVRSRDVGFVFQFYHLLPELSVLENTMLPAMAAAGPWRWPAARREVRRHAVRTLDRLGLAERLDHRPRELSGGEQQRVAIARALINRPKILLADEPTGNLDSKTGEQIIGLLKQLNAETDQTIVMVTHDQALAQAAGRVLHLRDGRLR